MRTCGANLLGAVTAPSTATGGNYLEMLKRGLVPHDFLERRHKRLSAEQAFGSDDE